jgi:polyhydroxyalkanoate synthesis regulator phasin
MDEKMKKIAVGGSAIALAIAMGLQTFVFGHSDMQTLKEEVGKLSERVARLEIPMAHE